MVGQLKNDLEHFRSDLRELSLDLWNHPETAWQEQYSSARLCAFLEAHGVCVTPHWLFPTAFKAEYGTAPGRTFAIAAEYDALPGIGHGCGHNLIATAGVAAFLAASRMMKEKNIPGTLKLLGTPAEESGGGKVKMLQKGCLDGIDACMMVHPSSSGCLDFGSTAIKRYNVVFKGKAAHAASNPELGVNALDAVMLLFAGVNAFRQQLPGSCRIHGIVCNGGAMPNIIPAEASCRFYLRSFEESWLQKLDERFQAIVKGAALMTGASYELSLFNEPYRSRKPNAAMNQRFARMMSELGEQIVVQGKAGGGSSDFGNFSHIVPGIHPYFGISDHTIPGHSQEMCAAAASDYGFEQTLKAAAAMAEIAVTFLADDAFADAVCGDFVRD